MKHTESIYDEDVRDAVEHFLGLILYDLGKPQYGQVLRDQKRALHQPIWDIIETI
jgi:hypothetical protein